MGNILIDMMGLLNRKRVVKKTEDTDYLVLGRRPNPDDSMFNTPKMYNELISIKDLKAGINSGEVTGSGTTNFIPIYTDGPNSVIGDSQLRQSNPNSNGLYQMRMENTDRFIINKPSSITSGDPEYLITQDGNFKVSFGWDDDGGGFGYLYNWSGAGLKLGSAGNNPMLEIKTTAGSEEIDLHKSIKFVDYGSGTYTGTVAYTLAVDTSGNVIETTDSLGTLAQTLALGNTTGGNDVIFSNGDNLSISTASGSDFLIKSSLTDETLIALRPDSGVSLYYNNDKKSETTSYGFRVGGDLRVTGLLDLFQTNDNTFAGTNAGNLDNQVGNTNTGFGENSQSLQVSGSNNSSLGFNSLKVSATGNNNTAIGTNSLPSSDGGSFNTALGSGSLNIATLGQGNTAIGYNALENKTTTNFNTAVGNNSLGNITSGFRNTAVGNDAGKFILDGTTANATAQNSVFIGDEAKAKADGETNQIVIGQGAIGNGPNTATLGNDSVTETYLKGDVVLKVDGTGLAKIKTNATGTIMIGDPTAAITTGLNVTGDITMQSSTAAINLTSATAAIYMTSPDGTTYRVQMANGGTFNITQV